MKNFSHLLLLLFLSLSNHLSGALSCCPKAEIKKIRWVASDYIEKAHRKGGELFVMSFMFSPTEAAWNIVEYKCRYSEFSIVFRNFISYCKPKGLPYLYQGYGEVGILFNEIYSKCIDEGADATALYERGCIYFDNGLYEECLADIQRIDALGKLGTLAKGISFNDLLFAQGISCLETNSYSEAIKHLSDLIEKDPNNKEAYYNRAVAFFEHGDFDKALDDYRNSAKSKVLQKIASKVSQSFSGGLLDGLKEGGIEAITDFFPSLLNTAFGIGNAIWVLAENPIDCGSHFANACYDASLATVEYLKTVDAEKLDGYVDEIKFLYQNYDALNDTEKGKTIGYVIGKYGTDVLATGATLKCISTCQKLKEANRIKNLEALASSPQTKEALTSEALKHCENRKKYFNDVKYNYDAHNKHILGHNDYDGKRSIFTHPDPEKLLKEFAGKGIPTRAAAGENGFKECIDFKEIIGIWKNQEGTKMIPTTMGSIHYGKKGAHIVPIAPDAQIFKIK